jgi:hypothetical protein
MFVLDLLTLRVIVVQLFMKMIMTLVKLELLKYQLWINDCMKADPLPSRKIDYPSLMHLSQHQQKELLDRYSECFSEIPGLHTLVKHEIPITSDFKPKQSKAYGVPENSKDVVDEQIKELLRL